jgi:hypothetical protein
MMRNGYHQKKPGIVSLKFKSNKFSGLIWPPKRPHSKKKGEGMDVGTGSPWLAGWLAGCPADNIRILQLKNFSHFLDTISVHRMSFEIRTEPSIRGRS